MDQCSFYSNIINISFFKKYGIKLRSIGRNPACINDPVIIEAITEPRDSCSIYWSNGAIGDTTFFNMEGTYYAYSLSKNGCIDTSMSFDVAFNPLPQKPIFEFKNYLLQIKNYFQGNLYLWYHNDSLINPILTDRHYPMYGGNYYLKLIDTNYCTSFSDTITVSSEQLIFNPVLYPNPSDNFINISYYTTDKSQIKIAIYSYLGLMAGEYEFNTFTGLNANTIDVSSLSQGIYFLEINFNRQKKVIKFVKILSKIE